MKRGYKMKRGHITNKEKLIIMFFSLVFMIAYPITFINSVDVQYLFSKVLRLIYLSLSHFKF